MKKIEKNYWFVNNNTLEIFLLNFHVKVNVMNNIISLVVIDDNEREKTFTFNNLEETMFFAENVISKCRKLDEVIFLYDYLFSNSKEIIRKINNFKISLTPEEIKQLIYNYFSEGKDYKITVQEELKLIDYEPDLKYYLIEHAIIDGEEKEVKTMLTTGDLTNVFNSILKESSYEVDEFKYLGGVHNPGYVFDDYTPYFYGIDILLKPREEQLAMRYEKEK